jgi:hypothetical protein
MREMNAHEPFHLRRLGLRAAVPLCFGRAVSRGPVERSDCSNERYRESNGVMPCSRQCVVVLIRELQPFDHRAHGAAFARTKPAVLEIEVVDDRGDPQERGAIDTEDRAQRFEVPPSPWWLNSTPNMSNGTP